MPDAKDNAKMTGDTHPPEVEDIAQERPRGQPDTEGAHAGPGDSTLSRDLQDEGKTGKGVNQAGYLKDKDGDMGRGREP